VPIDWTAGVVAEGLACFKRADYFNAHENWEEAWRASVGVERHLLQAHVQLAVGLCHEQRGNKRGALGQLRKSLAHFEMCPADLGGVNVDELRAAVRGWIGFLEDPEQTSRPPVPALPALTS
jgi:hypothetical protein